MTQPTSRHEGYTDGDPDSINIAIARAVSEAGMGVSPDPVSPDGEPVVQVIIRVSETTRDRWKEAAAASGVSMSKFVRINTDDAASRVLDCQHLSVLRYPWATICNTCGARF